MTTAAQSRQALRLLTGNAVAGTLRILDAGGDPESLRSDLLDGVPQLIDYYTLGSAALAADFYDDARERAAARGRFMAEPVVLDRAEKIGRAVAWATKPLIDGDGDPAGRLAEVVQLETARPYRDTIVTNQRRDPEAIGWRRITSGGCSFCRMLADRGAVYKAATARFASHPNCHCTAAPEFKGGRTGPEADAMQYVASKRRTTEADRKRLRDYLAENYGDN
ncbi:MAG TPA: hypothetical protein VFL58_02620 [Gaiellaceae bacterium]|nr:hypothetical protein [Gaiellaceae bacterium]